MGAIVRRLTALMIGLASATAACAGGGPAPEPSHTPCATGWDALPKTHTVALYTTATVAGLRAGADACFDRLIVDLGPRRADVPGPQGEGFQVRYVPEARSSGSGEVLPIDGGAILTVVVNAAAHDGDYKPTFVPPDRDHVVDVTGFRTFRQVAFLGTFEAQTELVIGVREELPFHAFVASGPGTGAQLVIDVAHAR
jgi:hypothetical protein